ncbi:hypothetical protein Gotur_014017 [Gossypium turneri]
MQLQLGLQVEGSALNGSAQSADWRSICYDLLGAILDNIYGGRIEMGWLQNTFPELRNDSTEVERIRYARAYILEMIRGYFMSDLLRNLVHLSQNWRLPITTTIMGSVVLSIFTSSSEPPIYIPTHNEFQWTPYEDPTIQAVIPDEFFQNLNIWHVKVLLVNYAIIEMHQTDRHKLDLQQTNTNWSVFFSEYIKIWEN